MLRRPVLALLGGLLVWIAFPDIGVWAAAPLGIALIVAACRDVRPAAGFGLGFVAGLGWFVPYVSWTGLHVGPLPWLALATAEAVFVGVFGTLVAVAHRRRRAHASTDHTASAARFGALRSGAPWGPWWPVVVAASWSACEWARASGPFGGFPWGRVAYSQADGPLLHLAAWGGPALLGFGTALLGCLVLAAVDALRHARTTARTQGGSDRTVGSCHDAHHDASAVAHAHAHAHAHEPTGSHAASSTRSPAVTSSRPALVPILVPTVAALLVATTPMLVPTPTDGIPARLMAVQGDAPRTGLDFNAKRRQILDNHGRVTRQAADDIAAGRLPMPDLVVWPENASDIDPFVNRDAGIVVDGAVDAIGRPVLVGAVLGGGRNDLTNTSILWEPGVGATSVRYDKQALVPFAEFMPYRAFFRAITRQVDLLERDFVPGHTPGVVEVPLRDGGGTIRAGLGICFEVAVDHVMDAAVGEGANLLVVQTNNAMFDFSAESAQQLAISRVRAVQYGRGVVHASNVGISALVTPDGVAHGATELFTPAVVSGTLPLRDTATLATRLGVFPDAAFAALAAAGLLLPGRRRGRATPAR
ncbi:apolipoprotein N-acyltransferase [Mobilicoccus pelagius]|uniref:Apolipoprotein N-acyltransferase n=1 Tax=Mobilicoccus pelagius NBRC 104925 TaxID=1089455 RepID=H5UTE8_9MICO|nr:apolipoprotein N-acyltransferase [Mobilicoccus pelagius]GAB49006.1 apolipoprotein N-acyltransferase [Mobilicoccus pelagius NBRC 104925]